MKIPNNTEHKSLPTKNKSVFSSFIKGFALSLLFFFSVTSTQAQELEITPTAGYFWGGSLRTYYGELRLGSAANYGVSLNYTITPGTQFEAFWFISNSTANYYEYGYNDYRKDYKLNTNYVQFAVLQEMNYGEALRPFGFFSMGTTIFNPESYSTVWQFSLGLGGGLKYYINDRFGIRVQGRFLLPVYWTGGYWYGYGYSSGTAIAQGDVSGGLIIVLN